MRHAAGGPAARGGTARGTGNWSRPRVRLLRGSARRRAGQRRGAQGCWRLAVRRPHGGGQKGRGALRPHGCRKRGRGMRKARARRRAAVAAFPARGDPVSARGSGDAPGSFRGQIRSLPAARAPSCGSAPAPRPARRSAAESGPERRGRNGARSPSAFSRNRHGGSGGAGRRAGRPRPALTRIRVGAAPGGPGPPVPRPGRACLGPRGNGGRLQAAAGRPAVPRAQPGARGAGPPRGAAPRSAIRVRRGRHRAGALRARGPIGPIR